MHNGVPTTARLLLFAFVLFAAAPSWSQGAPAKAGGEPDLKALAQKANNPLSDVWLLLGQNDYSWLESDLFEGSKQVNSFKFQPVMPVPVLDGDWNLIFRPVLTYNSVPLDKDTEDLFGFGAGEILTNNELRATASNPFGRTTGLGDTVLLTLLGPNTDDGFVWGGGITQIFPTAHRDILGQGKYSAGPAAIAIRLGDESGGLGIENWNVGFLAQHWWSYAGKDDRSAVSLTDIQYFINWRLNDTQLIGMTPNIRINWKARGRDKYSVPVGIGTIGMFKLGRMPIRWGVEVQYYVVQPDTAGPEWNLKFFFAPIILNPLK